MDTYCYMLQGDVIGSPNGMIGFWACRHTKALSEEIGAELVLAKVHEDWNVGESVHLGKLERLVCVAAWRISRWDWRKRANAGHAFYNDDLDAQRETFELEAKVANMHKHLRREILDDLV